MDPLHLCIAIGPVAVYLLLLGKINLSSSPFLTTGTRDALALSIAIGGFVIAGPMELFMPLAAAAQFKGLVWLPMILLYLLCVFLVVLLMRPRLVIYNVVPERLRPILSEVAHKLDDETRWAGDSLVMPNLGVQLAIESFPLMRNVQLVATGNEQEIQGWCQLEKVLNQHLKQTSVAANPRGISFVLSALMLTAVVIYTLLKDGPAVARTLDEMLRR